MSPHHTRVRPIFSLTLLLLFQSLHHDGMGTGYMTTVAGLWGWDKGSAACALEVGTLYPRCWGNHPVSGDLQPPVNVSFWAISGGSTFVCGLLYDSHYPSCWGSMNDSDIPSQFLRTSYSNINSGAYHVCAVSDNKTDRSGTVDCWGRNSVGQASPPQEAMISVTAGDVFTCGLLASTRHAICWGQYINSTRRTAPNASFESIFAGRYHMCGVEMTTKNTLCWGDNRQGDITPVQNINLTVITGGYAFTCGLREDTHIAVCWGTTEYDSTSAPAGVPLAVIASGDWFTCGVREDDQKMAVICWGTQDNAAQNYVPDGLRAAMGLCVPQCNEGEYELQSSELGISNQCPGNAGLKVCLRCLAGQQQCPPVPSSGTSSPSSLLIPPSSSSLHSPIGLSLVVGAVLSVVGALIIIADYLPSV